MNDLNVWIIVAIALVVLGIGLLAAAVIAPLFKAKDQKTASSKSKKELAASYEKMMQDDVYHIFSKEFHEELRNKARLDFQRVINENAMFLQQDLRLTTSEINDYLKKEIGVKLQEEFTEYQRSIKDVQQMAVESINNTVTAAQQQQTELNQRIVQEAEDRKAKIVEDFEANMAEVVSHYILKTIGEQIDLKDQMPYILREMQAQQDAMRKDMWL